MIRSIVIAASTLLLGTTAAVPPAFLRSDAPALEIRTSVKPVALDEYHLLRRTTPGMYRCSVRVHDEPGSNRVWGTKDIVLAPGESNEEATVFGQLKLQFQARLSKNLDQAETTVTVFRDEKVISRQTSTVWLQHRSDGLKR